MPEMPEPLSRRAAEWDARDPLDQVQSFLRGHFSDAETFDEVAAELRRAATVNTSGIASDLRALDAVLSGPLAAGVPARLVAWDANWVLDDPTDRGAIEFLHKTADMLAAIVNHSDG